MSAADKIAEARALIEPLSIHRMLVNGRLEDPGRVMSALADLADALAQENERLRSALERIRDMNPSVVTVMVDGLWRDACRDLQRIARIALPLGEGTAP